MGRLTSSSSHWPRSFTEVSSTTGVVTAFDRQRGLGEVTVAEGDVVTFHATAIADSSRDIAIGTRVVVVISPTHRGLQQATHIAVL